jgi:hypothetical protein
MSLKIKRDLLERIVQEELVKFIAEQLNEGPGDASRGTVLDDDEEQLLLDEPEDDIPGPGKGSEESLPTDSPVDDEATAADDGDIPELPTDGEEADVDLDALEAGEEPPSEEEEGTVAGELNGKTVDKISVDEDSKIMPGATEIVFTFRENPDALRILITKTGKVKYFYRGLHNSLDSVVSPVPDEDAPDDTEMETGDEEEELEDMTPLGTEEGDMPPEELPPEEEEPKF